MPRPARRPPSLPGLILDAAKDIERVTSTLDAELLLSTLLGSGYARLAPDRGAGLDALVAAIAEQAADEDTGAARVVGALLAGPGDVRPTGGYAYGDRYGDQSGYVATFAGDDGVEHAVVFLVDHTLGMVRDILVIAPASAVVDQFATDTDEMSWSAPLEPASVRVAAEAYLRATDLADELPEVLSAWVSWAGRRVGLPEPAVAATLDRIDALRAEFTRLGSTGERQSPAVRATAQLVAEGVDLADPAAVEEWLATYNASN